MITRNRENRQKGVTLLELLLVLFILSSTLTLGVWFTKKRENHIRKTFRQFIALNHQLDSLAKLKGRAYRLVITTSEEANSWWVEKQGSHSLDSNDAYPSSKQIFTIDTAFFPKPQKLPENLRFSNIEFSRPLRINPSKGQSYIYYLPEGQFNKIVLQVKGKKQYWSFFIDRLHGDLRIVPGEKKLEDFKQ